MVARRTIIHRARFWRPNTSPNFPVEIDWTHPLAYGLIIAVPGNEGAGVPRELVSGALATTMSAKWQAGQRGQQLQINSNNDSAQWSTSTSVPSALAGLSQISEFHYIYATAVGFGTDQIISRQISTVQTIIPQQGFSGPTTPGVIYHNTFNSGGTNCQFASQANMLSNGFNSIGISVSGLSSGSTAVYGNGIAATSYVQFNTQFTGTTHAAANPWCLGDLESGGGNPLQGSVLASMYWGNRLLDAQDHAWLNEEPWAVFKPRAPRVLYGFLSSGFQPAWAARSNLFFSGLPQ